MIWAILYSLVALGVFIYCFRYDWTFDENRGPFVMTVGDLFIYALIGVFWPAVLVANSITIFDRILCIRLWTRK